MTGPDGPDRLLAVEQEVAMPLASPGPEVLRFGDCALDLRSGELIRDGNRCPLPDQPFRILALLLRHPGSVVTREDLRREVWPDKTFVDFEHGLNAAVKRLPSLHRDTAPPGLPVRRRPGRRA